MKYSARSGPKCSWVLALTVAFVASFVLPCLCIASPPTGQGHCEARPSGFTIAVDSCCCGNGHPGAPETMAKVMPTPTAAPVAMVGVLPVSFTAVRALPAAPAAWSSHGPRALLVLRI